MQAKLLVVEGRAGRREVVLTLPASIGRRAHQTLQILHPTVSREHCELVEQDGQILVRDKKSANGTWIGGSRITESLLRPGDRLTVGPLVFEADYVPGNGAAIANAPSTKKAGTPAAKKGASTAAAKAPPAPADDFEAALSADLMAELGGISAPEEVDSTAAPTLDGEPLPAGDFDLPGDELNDSLAIDDLSVPDEELDVELLGGLDAELGQQDLALPDLEQDELSDVDFKDLDVESAELTFEPIAEVDSLELDDQAAADLDLDLDLTSAEPDFSDLAAETPASLSADSLTSDAEPALDDLVASDEPSAPWDAIGDELDADLSLNEEGDDVDLALGDLGLEAVELDSLEAHAADPSALQIDSPSAGALDLDDLNLESPAIDDLELQLPDALDEISADLGLDAELELPLEEGLSGEVQSAAASAAPPASLDDFFAGLNGDDSLSADDVSAIELDDLSLDAEISDLEFETDDAAPEIAEIDFAAAPDGAASVAGLEIVDELNLDVDLEFEDLKLDEGPSNVVELGELEFDAEDTGPGETNAIELDDSAAGEEAKLRIADLDLENDLDEDLGRELGSELGNDLESDLSSGLDGDLDGALGLDDIGEELSFDEVVAADFVPPADADAADLIFDLDSDEPGVAIDGPIEELHLFVEDEHTDEAPKESGALDESPATALDAAEVFPVESAADEAGLSVSDDLPLDVLADRESHEPSTSDEAAQRGTIFSPATDITADGDSQDLWPVDEQVAATDEFSLDELSFDSDLPSDELIAPELDVVTEASLDEIATGGDVSAFDSDLASASELTEGEPGASWSEPAAVSPPEIPTAPDDVDPFDFLSMEGTSAGAAEIVEPFVDDEDTPYDPDSPRQRLQGLSSETSPSTSESNLVADERDFSSSAADSAQSVLPASDADEVFFVEEPIADVAPAGEIAESINDLAVPGEVDETASAPLIDKLAPPEAEFVLDDDLLAFDEVEPAQATGEVVDELHDLDDVSPAEEQAAEDDLDSLFAELDTGAAPVEKPLSIDEPPSTSDQVSSDELLSFDDELSLDDDRSPAAAAESPIAEVSDEPLLAFDDSAAASDDLLFDNLTAEGPPTDDLLAEDLLTDDPQVDDLLTDLGESQATDETLDVNAESLLTFDETSVEELALLDAGDDAPLLLSPPDEVAPNDGLASLDDDHGLGDLDLSAPAEGELGSGDSHLGDSGLGELEVGDSELGELELGELNFESALDSTPEVSAESDFPLPPAPATESAAFDFLDAPSAGGATPPQAERIWWPFGDKSAANANSTSGASPSMPSESTARAVETNEIAELSAFGEAELPAFAEEDPLAGHEAPFESSATLAADELSFEDAPLGDVAADELALDEPLAFDDDVSAAPDVDLNLPSPTETDATIAFLDDDEPALSLGGAPDETTAELPLALDDDLGLSDPALDSLDLSTPSPGPSASADLTAPPASASPAAPARKWWQFWAKSDKPATKSPKPAKPAKAAKKSKAVAESKEATAARDDIPRAAAASPATDDLLLLGGSSAAADELLPDGPELDFAPLSLDDGPEPANSTPATAPDEENFRTFYADVVEEASPVVDDLDDLVFDAPEADSASGPSFVDNANEPAVSDQSSDLDSEPDFSAFDSEDPFGDESPSGAAPQVAKPEAGNAKLPGEAETVDDNLLDDFFKNF